MKDALLRLLAGIKATEDFVDALVGNYLVLLLTIPVAILAMRLAEKKLTK